MAAAVVTAVTAASAARRPVAQLHRLPQAAAAAAVKVGAAAVMVGAVAAVTVAAAVTAAERRSWLKLRSAAVSSRPEHKVKQYQRIETQAVHAGTPHPRIAGAVSMPVFQSASFEYAGERGYDELRYLRLNNTPNHLAIHRTLAALENAPAALVAASGMAAISTTLFTLLADGGRRLFEL